MIHKIKMPRISTNDNEVMLVAWLINDGDYVTKGTVIVSVETSKKSSDITATHDGFVTIIIHENTMVKVGEVIGHIDDSGEESSSKAKRSLVSDYSPNRLITAKAKEVIDRYQIDIDTLPQKKIIRLDDVLSMIGESRNEIFQNIDIWKDNHVLIYGAGRMGAVVAEILKSQHTFRPVGFVDCKLEIGSERMGFPIIANDESLYDLLGQGLNKIIVSIGFANGEHYRKPPFEMLKGKGFEFINVIHKNSVIENSVRIGVGNLICADAIIGTNTVVGNNCILNTGVKIAHDCIISDHCHIASGAALAGGVVVGENTLIGQNCTVYSDVRIGHDVVIQNGCNILKNIKDRSIIYGNG